ncbi:RNA-binding protein [Brevibacillus sp. NPDC003359]|uniref:RNA-binding protein n=1 Tax=unclassified Brevibacillus TaxID=2684853 RepID=UPI0036B6D2CA
MSTNDIFWTGDPFHRIENAMKRGEILTGLVFKVENKNKDGAVDGEERQREYVTMDLGGVEGYCSDEEFAAHSFSTLRGFIGHTVSVIVDRIHTDPVTGKKFAIVSRKRAEAKQAVDLLKNLKEKDIVNGTISGFNEEKETLHINLGGIDAFCYLGDWDYVRTPTVRDAGVIGEPVTVMVTKILPSEDPDGTPIIRVSRKEASKDPWDNIAEQFSPGSNVLGKVTNITKEHGIFVSITRGVTLLATLPNRSRLDQPVVGIPVRGIIQWIDEEKRRGKMVITNYPHGAPNRSASPGAYLFD